MCKIQDSGWQYLRSVSVTEMTVAQYLRFEGDSN